MKGGGEHGSATKTPPFDLSPDEWRRLKVGWGITLLVLFAVALVVALLVVAFGWIGIAWFFIGLVALIFIGAIVLGISVGFMEGDW